MFLTLFLKVLEATLGADDDVLQERQQAESNTYHAKLNADTDDLIKVLSDQYQQLLLSKERKEKISFYEKAILSLNEQAKLFPADEISEETRLSQEKINAAKNTYEHLFNQEKTALEEELVQQQQPENELEEGEIDEGPSNVITITAEKSDEIKAALHKKFYKIIFSGLWLQMIRTDSTQMLGAETKTNAEYLAEVIKKADKEPAGKTAQALRATEFYLISKDYKADATLDDLKSWFQKNMTMVSIVPTSVLATGNNNSNNNNNNNNSVPVIANSK